MYRLNYCFSIDPTVDRVEYGVSRFLNHSKKNPNLKPSLIVINDEPRVIFKALKDIDEGSYLTWDYGELRKHVLDEEGHEFLTLE